jgi:ferredoxin
MADRNDIWPENVTGPFYVDRACIACDSCCTIAPVHFRMQGKDDHSALVQQPVTRAEVERCHEALANCPVDAIGADGESIAAHWPHAIAP